MLRGAIIGLGSMGQNHLACYKSVDNVKIIAVCDTRPGHASTTIKNWGLDIPAYEDMVELIEKEKENIRLIGIAGPSSSGKTTFCNRLRIELLSRGIKPVMITGDHVVTASAIARELGILVEGDRAITGAELDAMTDEELDAAVCEISVYHNHFILSNKSKSFL